MDEMKKKIISHLFSILFVLLVLILGTIYVYYPNQQELLSSFSFLHQKDSFYIKDLSSGIKLAEAFPITDEEGLATDTYQFKVVNNSNHDIYYQIFFRNQKEKLEKKGLEILDYKYLRYTIQEEEKELIIDNLTSNEKIYEGVVPAHTERVFDFRIWLDEDSDEKAMGKSYIGKMEIVEIKSSI